jgi:uncharacterized metal-binding protein YceD (DUF177 family)
MVERKQNPDILRVAELSARRPVRFDLVPDADTLTQLAAELDLLSLRKLRFHGTLSAQGPQEWLLRADLGATVVQPCGITLAPVTTRLEEKITRRFSPEGEAAEPPPGAEIEMPEDDSLEPLGAEIDLRRVMIEALLLALPAYPRAEGAELGQITATEAGTNPLDDAASRPFAQLAALRAKLQNEE